MDALLTSKPLLEIILGTLGMILVIFVHGIGMQNYQPAFHRIVDTNK